MNTPVSTLGSDKLLEILALSPNATAVYTGETLLIQMASDAMIRLWGKDRQVIGQPIAEAIPELRDQPFIGLLQEVWRTGITYEAKNTIAYLSINGEIRSFYFDFVYEAIRNQQGETECILHTATDVTERNSNQTALRENEAALSKEQQLNEELATLNEALTTSNEELYAAQQKLQQLNNELESRVMARTSELSKSEANLRFIIEDAPVAFAVLQGREMIIESANRGILSIWGKTKDVLGKPLAAALPELSGQPFLQLLDNVFVSGEPFIGNEVKGMMVQDGEKKEVYTNFVYKPIKDAIGQTHSIMVVANVVSEQVEARKAVDAHRQKLQSIVTTTPIAITLLHGKDLVIEMANEPILQIWHRSAEQVIGRKLIDVFPELASQPFPLMLADVFVTGKQIAVPELPAEIALPDGSVHKIFVNFSYDPIFDEDGQVESILVTVIEVTGVVQGRKQLEESETALQNALARLAYSNEDLAALNEEMMASNEELISANRELVSIQQHLEATLVQLANSETKLRYMLAEAPVAISLLAGSDFVVEAANKKMLEVLGKTPNVIHKPLKQGLPELEGQPLLELLEQVYTSGEPYSGNEVKAIVMQGGAIQEIYANFVFNPLKDEKGQTTSIVLVANVVTDTVVARKKAEEAEENLRMAIESADLGSFSMSLLTNRLTLSRRSRDFYGLPPEDRVTLSDLRKAIEPEFLSMVEETIAQSLLHHQSCDIQYAIRHLESGERRWIRMAGKPYINNDGTPTRFLGVIMDITERKKDEERKNDFIGMVSHELKTPLTSLSGYIQVLQMKAGKTEDQFTATILDKVYNQVKRMTTMINGFLNVSRLESGKIQVDKSRFMLNDLIREMIEEAAVIQPRHTLIFEPERSLEVQADRDKIGSVISNLLSNAIKYSPNNRNVAVDCRMAEGQVQVSVRDNGIGVRPEDAGKLFERYYRAKSDSSISGFGIGLYLSAEIIQRHGGRIWVESEHGKGSTFFFSIPL